jgi:hypothetical protein
LLACNLGFFDHEYIDWQGNYENYDLHTDVTKELERTQKGREQRLLDGRLFSTCKVFPTKMNPDPLHKLDEGDRGVGAMRITVEQCSDLLSSDADGKSDPKVLVTYAEMTWRTATVQNDLCPIFNEDFRVPVWTIPTEGDPKSKIELKVSDEDDYLGLYDDFLGKVELDMASLIEECQAVVGGEQKIKKILPLLSKEGRHHGVSKGEGPRGTIELDFLWLPHNRVYHSTRHLATKKTKEVCAEPVTQQPVGEAGEVGAEALRNSGYVQDMTPQQLEEAVAASGEGMRIMV